MFYLVAEPHLAVMAVDVSPTPAFQASMPRVLFHGPGDVLGLDTRNVSRDGQRFAVVVPAARWNERGGLMGDVVYRVEIPPTRVKGPLRLAHRPTETEPVCFGTHGAIARYSSSRAGRSDLPALTIEPVEMAGPGNLS
jgi:hypothetical protein